MGLLDIFSSSPEKKIEKTKKVMLNEHHQAQVRQGAIYDLMHNEHPAAIDALVERLGVSMRDTIQNEKEQGWVHDILVDRCKEKAIEPLKGYIREHLLISKAILALRELISEEDLIAFLCEVLSSYEPKDHRSVDARQNLVDALGDLEESPLAVLLPYTLDHSDDVRVKVINVIRERISASRGDEGESAKALIEALTDPFASGRTMRAAGKALVDLKLNVASFAEPIAELEEFALSADGQLIAR